MVDETKKHVHDEKEKIRKERRCQEYVSDLRSSGMRAQMQTKEHQTKEIRKRINGGWVGVGDWSNKYKSPNLKALMMFK